MPYTIKETGLGETIPFLKGTPGQNSRIPLDRSVLVVAQWYAIPNPPAPIIIHIPKLVPRYATKSVLLPVKNPDGVGEPGGDLGEMVWAFTNPETRVSPSDEVLVPDTFRVTRIEKTNETPGLANATVDMTVLHFSWGPPVQTVSIFGNSKRDLWLDETVTAEQAMHIYERAGSYILLGKK